MRLQAISVLGTVGMYTGHIQGYTRYVPNLVPGMYVWGPIAVWRQNQTANGRGGQRTDVHGDKQIRGTEEMMSRILNIRRVRVSLPLKSRVKYIPYQVSNHASQCRKSADAAQQSHEYQR
jgi:hypothetical protein